MSIIGCDLHTRYQVIAMLESETGEIVSRRLEHEDGKARVFYAALSQPSLIGIEATGYTQWFERLVAELGHTLRWAIRLRFGPAWCGGRRPTRAMPSICSTCC
jgi:hypothetical protein